MTDALTLPEAAALLHQHEHTVELWAREAKIPAHRVGRKYLFLRSELIDWISKQPAKRAPCPSIAEVTPTGSSSPGQALLRARASSGGRRAAVLFGVRLPGIRACAYPAVPARR